ncbi:MAG: hypothetical protein ACW967_04375 [Candidatus Hodarchaeales archaeon]
MNLGIDDCDFESDSNTTPVMDYYFEFLKNTAREYSLTDTKAFPDIPEFLISFPILIVVIVVTSKIASRKN